MLYIYRCIPLPDAPLLSDMPPSAPFMRASLSAISTRLPTFSCSEISAVASSLADLRYRPPDAWLLPFADEARARLPGFELSHLGPLIYGMASLGTPLDEEWLGAFGRECVRKIGASREGESLGLMLWGMAMYDFMPDRRKWWEAFYRCVESEHKHMHTYVCGTGVVACCEELDVEV